MFRCFPEKAWGGGGACFCLWPQESIAKLAHNTVDKEAEKLGWLWIWASQKPLLPKVPQVWD